MAWTSHGWEGGWQLTWLDQPLDLDLNRDPLGGWTQHFVGFLLDPSDGHVVNSFYLDF